MSSRTVLVKRDSEYFKGSLGALDLFPDEILIRIFSYLPIYQAIIASRVSREFYRLLRDNRLWIAFYKKIDRRNVTNIDSNKAIREIQKIYTLFMDLTDQKGDLSVEGINAMKISIKKVKLAQVNNLVNRRFVSGYNLLFSSHLAARGSTRNDSSFYPIVSKESESDELSEQRIEGSSSTKERHLFWAFDCRLSVSNEQINGNF